MKNSNSKKAILKRRVEITPYKPNEINNEIYPDEDFVVDSNKSNNEESVSKKLQSLLMANKNIDLSICSTEISFSIQSEYDNIETLSNYKYRKTPTLQKKVKEIVTGIKSNLKSKTLKNEGITRKKTSFANDTNLQKVCTFHKKFDTDGEGNETYNSQNNNNDDDLNLKTATIKKMGKKKNLLNVINQNIERNYMNLNDPDLFYNEFFQKIFDKKKEINQGNIEDNPFNEDDLEILKKFEEINCEDENKSPLEKFNAIIEKI